MPFDEDPKDTRQEFPCECGGNIAKYGDYWECDKCDFKKLDKSTDDKEKN